MGKIIWIFVSLIFPRGLNLQFCFGIKYCSRSDISDKSPNLELWNEGGSLCYHFSTEGDCVTITGGRVRILNNIGSTLTT